MDSDQFRYTSIVLMLIVNCLYKFKSRESEDKQTNRDDTLVYRAFFIKALFLS